MRLWTLHPKYLDARGLVALWREALLAQAVLGGKTRGYTHHPQLTRFRQSPAAMPAIAAYLRAIHAEATWRAYRFDQSKIVSRGPAVPIKATQGQLDYEWAHLRAKLQVRDPAWLASLAAPTHPEVHPLFHLVPGPVAEWEVASHRHSASST